jgi:hypothetical protein
VFSSHFFSVRPVIETFLPPTDDWKISEFGGICDQKLSETTSILQRLTPSSTPVLNGGVMKLKLLLRDAYGLKYLRTSAVKPIVVSWRVVNLEKKSQTNLVIKHDRTIGDELEFSYTVPFFDHEIICFVNGKELIGLPLTIQLTSISEKLKCVFCQRSTNAIEAFLCNNNNPFAQFMTPSANSLLVKFRVGGSEKLYGGLCTQHLPCLDQNNNAFLWDADKTPQKCNLCQRRK